MKITERIDQQVNQIEELVKELKSEKSYRGTERLVQLTIQALLDLGVMVLSAAGGRTSKRIKLTLLIWIPRRRKLCLKH